MSILLTDKNFRNMKQTVDLCYGLVEIVLVKIFKIKKQFVAL